MVVSCRTVQFLPNPSTYRQQSEIHAPARIAELLEPFLGPINDQGLNANDCLFISTYIDILQQRNARINLTAIRDDEEIVIRHVGESLFAGGLGPLLLRADSTTGDRFGVSAATLQGH